MAGWVTEDLRTSQTSGTSAHCKVLWHACPVCTAMPSIHNSTNQKSAWSYLATFSFCAESAVLILGVDVRPLLITM